MGYMLCIASKNDKDQVFELFSKRDDFELKFNDFTCFKINWDSKAQNIITMAKEMNIGLDSVLFIDDNTGNLEEAEFYNSDIMTATPEIIDLLVQIKGNNEISLNRIYL